MTSLIAVNSRLPANVAEILDTQVAQDVKREGSKETLDVNHLRHHTDKQVVRSTMSVATVTPANLEKHLDASNFSEGDLQLATCLYFQFGGDAYEDTAKLINPLDSETDRQSNSFDPGAWEKHVGALMAAIIAVNVARQSSADMNGVFTQMAYAASVAQGIAIVKGGEAAMNSAIGGAVLAGTMSIGGAGLTIKGHAQKHTNIKTNGTAVIKHRNNVEKLTSELNKGPGTLSTNDKEVLKSNIRAQNAKMTEAQLGSALQEKTYSNNMTIGGTLSSMGMVMSSMLSSIMRLQEYAERQNEVVAQSEQQVNKSVSEAATQIIGEDTALIGKMLEAIEQMIQGRASTMSAIASSRV
ncbi:hypothetical protein J1G36_25760 [Pseudomonas carnis]|uniref:hypothetical protein n=1 Tax=Pseudomonas TaxID=286 RepID=UPI000F57BB60|nr:MULTISPECIES: hypothetical protein [Pseudomonas]AZC90107.1 hypothetical protein C4K29_3808 [Pseudomonas chlororaphis subsp. piscium]MBY8955296.1 hypothetical protein [Pseudomonas carnis]